MKVLVMWRAGIEADVRRPDEVGSVAPYDGVILGSSVSGGRWLAAARKLVERDEVVLASRPVWLFSSGPVGEPALPEGEPPDGAAIRERIHAVEHRVFAGKLERRPLGPAERAIVTDGNRVHRTYTPVDAANSTRRPRRLGRLSILGRGLGLCVWHRPIARRATGDGRRRMSPETSGWIATALCHRVAE